MCGWKYYIFIVKNKSWHLQVCCLKTPRHQNGMWEMEIGNMSVQERKLPMTALHEIFKDFSWCGRTFALGVEWDHGERRDRLLDGMTWQILQSVYVSWSWVQIKMEAKESRHISREDGKADCIWPTEQWEIRWGEKRSLWRTRRVKGENKGNGGP